MKKILRNIFILLLFCIFLSSSKNSFAFEIRNDEVVNSNKVWNIQFNNELKFDDVMQKSISVVDSTGKLINTKLELGKDMKSILVRPPVIGYVLGDTYTLKINTDIYSTTNIKLQDPIQMTFKINNNILLENNENLKIVFNDNCSNLLTSGWSRSPENKQDSFIADNSDNENIYTHVPYEQYLFNSSSLNSVSKISKDVNIGSGPFNIELDAKIMDLQTPTKNGGYGGFAIDITANKKRYRLSFNSKSSDNNIKINLLNKASTAGSFQTVETSLPIDNNIHRWSIKNDGNDSISVLLDGTNIANFTDPQLASAEVNDKVTISNDMSNTLTGENKVYMENFAIVKSLSIKDCTVIPDDKNQTVNASISMFIEDEKILLGNQYKIKFSLYKNDRIVAEDTATLSKKDINLTLNNITQSGEMKLVATVLSGNKKIDEITKTLNINIEATNIEPGQTITSEPGKVFLYDKMDKMVAQGLSDVDQSGWKLEPYTSYENNSKGTIIANKENAQAINMPVKLNGWFRVYVGYVTGTESFKIGKTDESSLLQIDGDISLKSNQLYGDQFINEKSTIVSNFDNNSIKIIPNTSQIARIAYIKLVGLNDQQISVNQKQVENKKSVLYDFDGYTAFFEGAYPDIESLKNKTVDNLTGKNIGELNWCLGTTGMLTYNSAYAGKAFEGLEAFDSQLRDGDVLAKYHILNILSSGKSPLEIVADRGNEKGMKVNASLRMDTFYSPTTYGFLNGAMYNDYKEFTQTGSFFLSYYYPEVRNYIKNVLLEVSSFNNVSGVTLDFCRYPTLFGEECTSEERIQIMNEFLRGLRSELPKNKTITIRIPYDKPIKYGFDVNTWVKEGLLDRLVASSIGSEEFFNIEPYVEMVKNTNVQLYIGISADVSGHDITKEEESLIKQGLYTHNKEYLDIQQYLIRAYDVYKAGADGIFLFNSSSKLLIDNDSPIQSTFIGEKALIEKWREFDYTSGSMINKISVQQP